MLPWVLLAVVLLAAVVGPRVARRVSTRLALRAVHRFRARVDRFKLTDKAYIRASLVADERVREAAEAHAREHGLSDATVRRRVEEYIDEIVPSFNIVMYYRIGYAVSRALLGLFYRISVDHVRSGGAGSPGRSLPRESIVLYLMNHRSNADYLLVAYALAGQVSISYAVGEWARAFPLEYLFKSFGSYFVRRRYREPLYHTVLERYVHLITRNGVTQGIFPEGGLTRDGRLQPGKIGLLDYVIGVAREPGFAERMYVVPVAVNYDRVLEDRSLLLELDRRSGGRPPPRLRQLGEVAHYVGWNLLRILTGRWRRYGRAAVMVGEPIALGPWLARLDAEGAPLFSLPRHERLARVQGLCDELMERIGALVPVTPVPLACAAIQSLGTDFVPRSRLLERMSEMRDALVESNACVLRADRDIEETLERAERMLGMRRVLLRDGGGYAVLPSGRPLVSYYANGIAHLLGPFEGGIAERDALPALAGRGRESGEGAGGVPWR